MPPIRAGTAQISGKRQHPERGPLPAPNNSQPTDRSTSRPERPRARRRQLTGRSRRQSRGPERPGRPGQRPAKDTTRTADQPPDPASRRDTTSNSKHKAPPFTRMRRGGRPAQGGTPATFAHRWPGHWQARPPLVGGLPPCAGLALALPAGATAGTPARRRRSPRPAARECAGRRRLRRQCARRF